MPGSGQTLTFYATLLRDEIKQADAKVSAGVASSSIILSANFLMLRSEGLTWLASLAILVASGCALAAMIFSILAILPKERSGTDTMFWFKHTGQLTPEEIEASVSDPDAVETGLAALCQTFSRIVDRKYARVRTSLRFLMFSAVATSGAVVLRFLGQETFGLLGL